MKRELGNSLLIRNVSCLFLQLMVAGALGGTGAHVQSLAAKEHKIDIASATVLRRPVVATCAWDRQTNLYLVTKATVQVCKGSIWIDTHFRSRHF